MPDLFLKDDRTRCKFISWEELLKSENSRGYKAKRCGRPIYRGLATHVEVCLRCDVDERNIHLEEK